MRDADVRGQKVLSEQPLFPFLHEGRTSPGFNQEASGVAMSQGDMRAILQVTRTPPPGR
jgi:hypothetical protein